MRVAFDASCLASNGRGFARYVQVLLEGFRTLKPPDLDLRPYSDGRPRRFPLQHALWRSRELVGLAKRDGCDLVHFPDNASASCSPLKAVVTVHDISPLLLPGLVSWPMRLYFRKALGDIARRADAVIAVSERDRRDLEGYWGASSPPLKTVYNGIPEAATETPTPSDPPYFLFVGALEARKNLGNLIEGFARFKARTNLPHRLALVGAIAKGFGVRGTDPGPLLAACPRSRDIAFLGALPVGSARLQDLYRRASALALVSRYETFGFPYLEAWSAGCPVIGTTAGAGPEVVGDAGLLADPADPDAIAAAMERLARDPDLRSELIRKGRERLKRFTAEGMARGTLDVYREVLR